MPQIGMFGKNLGIPADIMGFMTSFLPITYFIAKPIFGFLLDAFSVSAKK